MIGANAKKMEQFQARAALLREHAAECAPVDREVILESIEELTVSMEELVAAEEELQARGDELVSAHYEANLEHRRYKDLFDNAPDAYLVTDAMGAIGEANRAAAILLDVPAQHLAGKVLATFVPEEDRQRLRSFMITLAAPDGNENLFTRLRSRQGNVLHVFMRVSAMLGAGPQPLNLRWLIRDITAQVNAQREVSELRERLQRVEQLALLGTGVAELAHQVRNPLHSIRALAECALSDPDSASSPAGPDLLRSIADEAARCDRVINVVLRAAQDQRAPGADCDLNELVREAPRLAALNTTANLVTVEFDLAPDLPRLLLNPAELEQVWVNLIENSAQAAGGPVRLRIRTERLGANVRMTFEDDGPGIPPELLERVFEPFFSTRKDAGGTGLGLSIVRRIILDNQGHIHAENRPEGGARFIIEFPLPPAT